MHWCSFSLHLVLLCFSATVIIGIDLDVEVEQLCISKCPKQLPNFTDVTNSDVNCDFDCIVSQCQEGCKQWKKAKNLSCQDVCLKNGSAELLTSKEFHCVVGCNDAMGKYFEQLKMRLGTPPAPVLVADSLTATSLRLLWNFPPAWESGLTYRVQWQYEELSSSWQYCRNQTWGPKNTVFVDNLQPYTKYRFRIAVFLFAHADPPIISEPSVVINTLPSGLPASPPAYVQAVAVDSNIISVSWEPGPFPHGPLLSYMLNVTENHPNGSSTLKDIPAENRSYMLRNLRSARNYTVSLQMINNVGAGPAKHVIVSTPMEPEVKDTQNPVLILGASHSVIEQGSNISDEPIVIYNTSSTITGVAIHVQKQLLFVADSEANIHRIPLRKLFLGPLTGQIILSAPQLAGKPSLLSIDWLNDRLYILEEVESLSHAWQISHCNFNGEGFAVAVAGLRDKPHDMQVDPYNGYLFWAIHNGGNKGGLYRLDLADISNGVEHNVTPEPILLEPNLGAFTVDHTNFKIYVSNQNKTTVHAISLDQKEIIDARPKIAKSKLEKVVSLATAGERFYWTDGEAVFYEEYHEKSNQYFHNSYLVPKATSYNKVLVNKPTAQPIPVPVNPPTSVQAIFGTHLAKITWIIPHLLGGQGKGAWQNWSYEISVKNLGTNVVKIYKHINVTSYTIANLTEDTGYVIKAAARTSSGKGPWSSEFKGVSLKKQLKSPKVFWSATAGLLKSDPTGENVETLIDRSDVRGAIFKDLTWFEDQIYVVTNMSQVYSFNLSSHRLEHLLNIDSVDSIAVDWLGRKLYWSNLKQQIITRGNLNGHQQERLPIFTMAKEMTIDSVNAYIYWSTGFEVECARLNGSDKFAYYRLDVFSGKQVMGLTLDMDHQMVYWIVRSSEGSKLFRAPMANGSRKFAKEPAKESFDLQKLNIAGPLSYFNKRLIWLQDHKNAVISDLQVDNIAIINGKSFLGLNMIYVMDPTLHTKPNISSNHSKIVVIPEIIEESSVKVIGYWNNFNITWSPIVKVNFGKVLYEIKVDNEHRNGTPIITSHHSIKYWEKVQPFSKLVVSLRAFTYWGTSPQIRVELLTPPSVPSAPLKLRSFLSLVPPENPKLEQSARILLRWDQPLHSNGLLKGYKIDCWLSNDYGRVNYCSNITRVDQQEMEFDMLYNKNYSFHVRAFTEVGDGENSELLEVNTLQENPLPVLLTTTLDSMCLYDADNDTLDVLLYGISKPIDIRYIYKEDKIIWLNEFQELFIYRRSQKNKKKLLDVYANATVFTVDWVERSLYYVQINDTSGESFVYKIDFNRYKRAVGRQEFLLKTAGIIGNIEVCPFNRTLYWTELKPNSTHYSLKKSSLEAVKIQDFFQRTTDSNCNCPQQPKIAKVFALDHSKTKNAPTITMVDAEQKEIFRADKEACRCQVLLEKHIMEASLPLTGLYADFQRLYFTNATQGQLYKAPTRANATSVSATSLEASRLRIFGQHVQPYPDLECLLPKSNKQESVTLLSKTSSSLKLKMPPLWRAKHCENTSIASVEYEIYYKVYEEQRDEPKRSYNRAQHLRDRMKEPLKMETWERLQTFEDEVTLEGLKSFTKYTVQYQMTNFDGLIKRASPLRTSVFQTSVGAPSAARNVTVTVLNPQLVQVRWLEPLEIDGESVYYQVHWQNEVSMTGVRHKEEQPLLNYDKDQLNRYGYLVHLSPNGTYDIWVRAFSQTNGTHTDSEPVRTQTYPEPGNITLANSTAYSLSLQWRLLGNVEKYVMQYALWTSNDWRNISESAITVQDEFADVVLDNLKPKTQYKFRLILKYVHWNGEYVWPRILHFTFETLGDKPSPPGVPKVHRINDLYQVKWEPSIDNGSPIKNYSLDGRKFPYYRRSKRSPNNRTAWSSLAPSVEEPDYDWERLYNGNDTWWILNGSMENFKYSFRVYAWNEYGRSNASEESEQFELTATPQIAENNFENIIIATSVPVVFLILAIIFLYCCKCCHKNKKMQKCAVQARGPDLELATLRELPRRTNFIQNLNVLYVSANPTVDDLTHLPHIRRDQIILKKFLGSGAFGEVFEGTAKGLTNSKESDVKVAVKTLRKGASDSEKSEFLQEAQLMSHFKHDHILQLLGVCLDNDPHFIIMELMQGGDLLTYLRSSRAPTSNTPPLNLIELLKMCVDVANGCKYLEEMHFVHRDLACRNCLVSSTDPLSRIVKIGDFGLARDIYKNDYYRKEGEGLLPVRWMAPESLVDGVFTCQSDVWAFGVLLWEIMTLGQQPYPARNNLEVLHYVRRGGRLGKPTDCPEKLHELMLQCWQFEPDRRPSFKDCLEELEVLHSQTARNPVTGVHDGQYISTVSQHFIDGICNQAYFQECNSNNNSSSGVSWKSGSEEESSKEKRPFLLQISNPAFPKYIELLRDEEEYPTVDSEGYEIPTSGIQDIKRLEESTKLISSNNSEKQPSEVGSGSEQSSSGKLSEFNKMINDLTTVQELLKPPSYCNMDQKDADDKSEP